MEKKLSWQRYYGSWRRVLIKKDSKVPCVIIGGESNIILTFKLIWPLENCSLGSIGSTIKNLGFDVILTSLQLNWSALSGLIDRYNLVSSA